MSMSSIHNKFLNLKYSTKNPARRRGRGQYIVMRWSESKNNAFKRFLDRKQVLLVPKHEMVT